MVKVDLWCTGQIADAREYLTKIDVYSVDEIASMSDEEIIGIINDITEEKGYRVITKDNGQDVGLVPEEAWNQIIWFQR